MFSGEPRGQRGSFVSWCIMWRVSVNANRQIVFVFAAMVCAAGFVPGGFILLRYNMIVSILDSSMTGMAAASAAAFPFALLSACWFLRVAIGSGLIKIPAFHNPLLHFVVVVV